MKKKQEKKKALNLRLVIISLLILAIAFNFRKIFLLSFFAITLFWIRYWRRMINIPFSVEPFMLFGIISLKLFGYFEGVFITTLPNLLADLVSGKLKFTGIIFALIKFLTLIPIWLYSGPNLVLVSLASFILINELLSLVLIQITTGITLETLIEEFGSIVIRIVYFSLFLNPMLLFFDILV